MTDYFPSFMKLEELCTFENGDRSENYPSGNDFVNEGIPFVNGGLIENGKVILEGMNYITREKYNSLRAGKAKCGDILWSIRGSFEKVALCPFEECAIASALVIVRPKENINPLYIYCMMNSPYFTKQCQNSNNGSVQANLSIDVARSFLIPWLPEESRDQFVSTLTLIDSKIANNTAICSNLEAMSKLLYDYWFVQFDFPGENGKPYKSSGGKMVWNDELKREIPAGWDVNTIGSIVSLERGISYSTDDLMGDGIPMINLGSFTIGGGYKEGSLKSYSGSYLDDKKIFPYDLILCLTQQTSIDPSKDVIGCVMLVPDIFNSDVVISQDLTKIVCSDDMKFFLVQYFNAEYCHRYITGYASGSNILHLDVNGVLRHFTCLPSKDILQKYSDMVKPMWKKRSECMLQNQQLTSLRDFLLPMLMNGQVKAGA